MNRFVIGGAGLLALVSPGLGALASPAPGDNLIQNGSFESPVVRPGGYLSLPVGSTGLAGWEVTGPDGTDIAIASGAFTQSGVAFPAQDGLQWIDLTGESANSAVAISQTVATVAGREYRLSYWIGNTTGAGGQFGTVTELNVTVDATSWTDANATESANSLHWQLFDQVFAATGASTTISFENRDPVSDNSAALDDVVLEEVLLTATPIAAATPTATVSQSPATPSGVPTTPASGSDGGPVLALLLATILAIGVGLFFAWRRRQRRRPAPSG